MTASFRLAGAGGPGDGDDAKGGSADRLPIGYQCLKARLLEGAGIELEAALVAAKRPLALAAFMPTPRPPPARACRARRHAVARGQVPGEIGVVGEKRPPVERKQPLGKPLE